MARERSETFGEFKEHSKAAVNAWRGGLMGLVPESIQNFAEKGREGQKEALLAMRSLLDVAIDHIENPDRPATKSGKKVKVEVE